MTEITSRLSTALADRYRIERRLGVASLLAVLLGGCSDIVNHSVSVVIPAEIPTIESGVLRLSLFSFDPNVADIAASLVDRQELAFIHACGERDEFRMDVSGAIEDDWQYYIDVRGYELTPDGEVYVLGDGVGVETPSEVVMQPITQPVP